MRENFTTQTSVAGEQSLKF